MNIHSDLTTLSRIAEANLSFNVPIYQRLYVWRMEQIRTLLEDLFTAYQNPNREYYIGGALVLDQRDGGRLDLIDGQQRFTTLWMMSLVWKGHLEPFLRVNAGGELRISFPIRPEVNAYFESRAGGKDSVPPDNGLLIEALNSFTDFREGFPKRLAEAKNATGSFDDFTAFVFGKVQLILTRVPRETDLNKLFEVINNRGVQLQHHEILKARLLKEICEESAERERYAALWDACSHMDDYAERNLREATGVSIAALFGRRSPETGTEVLAEAEQVLESLREHCKQQENGESLEIERILALDEIPDEKYGREDREGYESREVRSIVSFSMLLQHTLRIWLARHPDKPDDLPKILDKELLELFECSYFKLPGPSRDARSFIRLLWRTRYAFDKHIIKWVTDRNEERHMICTLHLNISGKYRSLQRRMPRTESGGEKADAFSLLQSMLYHSQQITTHYWLTPLLAHLLDNPGASEEKHLAFLRRLDNRLHMSEGDAILAKRSERLLREPGHVPQPVDIRACLSVAEGLAFSHYWFYKLEFVLWDTNHLELELAQRNAFRMTAKTSVEHISPQAAKEYDSNKVTNSIRDNFGNLALVSRSLNSEFSNKTYLEKQAKFIESNRDRIDCLKMEAIYREPAWGDDLVKQHQEDMISLLESYVASC